MKIQKLIVKDTNSYILYDETTLESIIIDPGFDANKFINFIDDTRLILKHIVLTHHHYDHIGAVSSLMQRYNCPLSIHKNDVNGIKDPKINLSSQTKQRIILTPNNILVDKSLIEINNICLRVIHTPGHTEGSICLKVKNEDIIFTGDTLFSDGIGRWDLPGGNEKKMINTIKNKVSNWDDNLLACPGHGEGDLIKNIKNSNPEYNYIIKNC